MLTFSRKGTAANRHFTKCLGVVIILTNSFSDIADAFKVFFLTIYKSRAGIYPDNITVIMRAKIKGLTKII